MQSANYLIRDTLSGTVQAIVERCKTFTTLSAIGKLPVILRGIVVLGPGVYMYEVRKNINNRLGVSATTALGLVTGKVGWVWRAEKDTTLTWKNIV